MFHLLFNVGLGKTMQHTGYSLFYHAGLWKTTIHKGWLVSLNHLSLTLL